MFKVWEPNLRRPTMDIDMLGITSNDESNILEQMRETLLINEISDGLDFKHQTLKASKILEEADYQGLKVKFGCTLDSAQLNVQIDIGFGDIVYPKPEKASLSTLLDFPAPVLLCYSKESLIAEKFDAMISRGMTNSRMKDFYDIWLLSRQFNFEGETLAEAIRLTLKKRHTNIANHILAFSQDFIMSKQKQWAAFRKKLEQEYIPESFQEIVSSLEVFLRPTIHSMSTGKGTLGKWTAPGPWV